MAPPQGPHIHGAYTPPPAEPPRWSIASGDSGDGREPDPRQRQLRMESLQAMSEAARRADNAAGAPARPPLQRVHGDVSKATHSRGAYKAEAALKFKLEIKVRAPHAIDVMLDLHTGLHQPHVWRDGRPLRVRLHGAAVRQVGATHSSSSPPTSRPIPIITLLLT